MGHMTNAPGIGSGSQTWQDVSASRASGTTYYNTTGRPIEVAILCTSTQAAAINVGAFSGMQYAYATTGYSAAMNIIVPPGQSYALNSGSMWSKWYELR